MSTRERPKDDKKKSDAIDEWLDDLSAKTKAAKPQEPKQEPAKPASPKDSSAEPETKQTTSQLSEPASHQTLDDLLMTFTKQLPTWIQKPWMYVKPTHPGHYQNWIESWKQLILKYCEMLTVHVINIYDIRDIHPFTNVTTGKDLSTDELTDIVNAMVEQDVAKWLDDDTIRARIYYRTDEQWAELIYQFTLDQGYATDILTMYELKKLDQPWTKLPDTELALVLDLLVAQNKAEWIGSDRDTIQFKI